MIASIAHHAPAQRLGVQPPQARFTRWHQNSNDLAREAVGLQRRVGPAVTDTDIVLNLPGMPQDNITVAAMAIMSNRSAVHHGWEDEPEHRRIVIRSPIVS
jgi:hypothetical protein